MNMLRKMIAELLKKGFATEDEKKEVNEAVEDLDKDKVEEVKEDLEKVNELPEEEPINEEEVVKEEVEKGFKAVKKSLSEELKTELDAFKKSLKEEIELSKKKVGIYNKDIQTNRKDLNVKMRGVMGALINGDEVSMKEMTTDATGTPYAGYTVDSELSAEIRHLTTEYGVARKEMMAIQLSKNSYKANNLTTDITVGWVDEGSALSSTQAVLGQETLELKKLGAISCFTSELLEDEEIDLIGFVAGRVAEGFAEAEDEAFFNGDGTSTYGDFTGLLENSSINEVTMTGTTFASIDADDLYNMMAATPQDARKNGKFLMNFGIMGYVRKLKDDNGDYIYQRPSESGPATIWGKPVVEVEVMPGTGDSDVDTSFVLFGDLKKACILGYKGGLRAEMFNAGTIADVAGTGTINLITTDRKAVRWVERVGYVVILTNAVTKLTTASSSV